MRFERVMLANPRYKGHSPAYLPAGLGYIAVALAHAGMWIWSIDKSITSSSKGQNIDVFTRSSRFTGDDILPSAFISPDQTD